MIKSLLLYGPMQAFSAITFFIVIVIQSRSLGFSEYGSLALVLLIVELVRMITCQWISTTIFRYYNAVAIADMPAYIGFFSRKLLICQVLGILIILGYVYLVVPSTWSALTIVLAVLLYVLRTLHIFFSDLLRLQGSSKDYRTFVFFQAMGMVLFNYAFLLNNPTVPSALLATILSYIFATFIILTKKSSLLFIFSEDLTDKELRIKLSKYGFSLVFSIILGAVASRIDRFVLSETINLKEFGKYTALYSLYFGIFSASFTVIASALYPGLLKVAANIHRASCYHRRYLQILLLANGYLLFVLFASTEQILMLLFTQHEAVSKLLCYSLCLFSFFWNLKCHYIDHGFHIVEANKYLNFSTIIGLFIFGLSTFLGAKYIGVVGAAVAMLLSVISLILIEVLFSSKAGYRYRFSSDIFINLISIALILILAIYSPAWLGVMYWDWLFLFIFGTGLYFYINSKSIKYYIKRFV